MPEGWQMMPFYGMIFGPIIMIVVLATVGTVVVLIVRWIGGGPYWGPPHDYRPPLKTPLNILEERFAKGSLTWFGDMFDGRQIDFPAGG